MNEIRLKKVSVAEERVDYEFSVSEEIRHYFGKYLHLFAGYDRIITDIPESILLIPFVGNIMPLAWLTDSIVYVPSIDKTFYESLNKLKAAYQTMYPNCRFGGRLEATCIIDNTRYQSSKTAQLFTGGLDATTTFIRHKDEKPLLMLTYGKYNENLFTGNHYEEDAESEKNYLSDKIATEQFAIREGTEAAFVRSNYVLFIKMSEVDQTYGKQLNDGFWHGLQHAMGILSITVPVAYKEYITTIYIASSNNPQRKVTCASDPSTDNEFKFASSFVVHDGYELTDEDKAEIVVDYQKKLGRPFPLRVCSWNDHNCGECEKCVRRMLQLNAEGGDPHNFGFNIEKSLYRQTKEFLWYNVQFMTPLNITTWKTTIKRMVDNFDNVYDKEVVEFLKTYDFYKEKKIGLYRYYTLNFFSILKRKLNTRIAKNHHGRQ